VLFDGKPVCTTPGLHAGDAPVYLSLPLNGTGTLQLAVTGDGASYGAAHVNLCNMRLSSAMTAPPPDGPAIAPISVDPHNPAAIDFSREQHAGGWHIDAGTVVDSGWWPARLDVGSPTWTNYEFSTDAMKGMNSVGPLLFFRDDGPNRYYSLSFGGPPEQQNVLARSQEGEVGPRRICSLRSTEFEAGRWYRIRVRCAGAHIQAWVDDTPIADIADDNNALLSGEVGLGAWGPNVHYRNMKVTSLDGKVLFEGLP